MFDATFEGKEAGYQDALAGKNSHPNRHISKVKAILSPKFVRTFLNGYKQGYREGGWKRSKQTNVSLSEAKQANTEKTESKLKTFIADVKSKMRSRSKKNTERNYGRER